MASNEAPPWSRRRRDKDEEQNYDHVTWEPKDPPGGAGTVDAGSAGSSGTGGSGSSKSRRNPIFPLVGVFLVALLSIIACNSAVYAVDEKEYALQLRFGELTAVRNAGGLYVKAPFIESIQRIERRTLQAELEPLEVPDQDKERLIIEMVIRYRITNPQAFRESLRTEATAKNRLQNIAYSAMRDAISQHDRTEVIGAKPAIADDGRPIFDPETNLPVTISLENSRAAINEAIISRIREDVESQNFGITVISAGIKRADFPASVTNSIINRLREERNRVAQRHRADGEEEYRRRIASVDAEAAILLAEARRDAQRTRGEAEAEAIALVRNALTQDPEFYTFQRTLESYRKILDKGATVIISSEGDHPWLKYLFNKPELNGGKPEVMPEAIPDEPEESAPEETADTARNDTIEDTTATAAETEAASVEMTTGAPAEASPDAAADAATPAPTEEVTETPAETPGDAPSATTTAATTAATTATTTSSGHQETAPPAESVEAEGAAAEGPMKTHRLPQPATGTQALRNQPPIQPEGADLPAGGKRLRAHLHNPSQGVTPR